MRPRKALVRQMKTTVGADLARFAGVSENTIKNWRRLESFPINSAGETVYMEFARWMLERTGVIATSKAGCDRKERKEAAQLRKLEAEATQLEEKARVMISTLVDRHALKTRVDSILDRVRDRLRTCADEVTADVAEPIRANVREDVQMKIALVLLELNKLTFDVG